MIGGLLVALAILATWWSIARGEGDATTGYVVASGAIAPGTVLTSDHLSKASAELPSSMESQAFRDEAPLIGAVVLGPIGPGELIQLGSVAAGPHAGSSGELSFAVEVPRAVAGTLQAGDRIDVYATYGDGTSAETGRILTATTVRRASKLGEGSLGESRHQVITVSLSRSDDAQTVVNATRAATITAVRVTGTVASTGVPAGTADAEDSADAEDEAGG